MRFILKTMTLAGIVCLALVATSIISQAQTTTTAQATQQAVPVRAAKPAQKPTTQASSTLAAPGTVAFSAACCKKTCGGDSAHCGQNCSVVDSLSECAGENWHNISFECPANKGMVCVGSSCSCQ
jgi:hypothetical protein